MKNQEEIWGDIKGYEGSYQISTFGIVKSLERLSSCSRVLKEKVLKPSVGSDGYLYVVLYENRIAKNKRIHQLVAELFLNHKPCGYKLVVNHIDFNKLNNNINNLEIITQRENTNKKHIKSSSKYTGVSWNKNSNKWMALIWEDGKLKHLGYFTNELEASKYYEDALLAILNNKEIKVKKAVFTSKYKGVYWNKQNNKWRAQIKIYGKTKYLGLFKTELEASEAYQNGLKQLTKKTK